MNGVLHMRHVDINLIQTRTKPKEWLIISVFLVVLVMCILAWFWSIYQQKHQQVENLENMIAAQVSVPVAVEEDPLIFEFDRYKSAVEWALTQPYSKLAILLELSKKLPERGYFTSYIYNNDSIELEVQFDTHAEAAFYLTSIQQSSFITQAKILSVSKESLTQENAINEETFVQPRTIAVYSILINQSVLKDLDVKQEGSP